MTWYPQREYKRERSLRACYFKMQDHVSKREPLLLVTSLKICVKLWANVIYKKLCFTSKPLYHRNSKKGGLYVSVISLAVANHILLVSGLEHSAGTKHHTSNYSDLRPTPWWASTKDFRKEQGHRYTKRRKPPSTLFAKAETKLPFVQGCRKTDNGIPFRVNNKQNTKNSCPQLNRKLYIATFWL